MQDLTKGNPLKVILFFTIPLLIGSFFQLAYNFADSIIVGQILGKEAFASVGATGSLTFLILGFAQGLTAGLTIIIAQTFGAKDEKGIRQSFVHGVFFALMTSLILTGLALSFLRPSLELMQTPDNLIDHAQKFLSVIYSGMIFTIFFNYLSNVLRSLGNAKTPLVALIIASVINVVLDFLFILNYHLGVFGAGLATIIAQAFSVLFLAVYLYRKVPYCRLKWSDWRLDKENLKKHAKLGFPMGFQFSIIAIGAIILQINLNQLGTDAIAAQAIATKTDQLAMLPMINLGLAISTFTAQNYGAKAYTRILQGLYRTILIAIFWAITFAALLILFNRFFSSLFLSDGSQAVYDLALSYYVINGALYWILATIFVLRSFIQGLGKGLAPTLAGIMELVMRAGVATIGSTYFGFNGIAASNPAAWTGALLILLPTSIMMRQKLKAKESELTISNS